MVRQKATTKIFGDWDTSYKVLLRFIVALEKYNGKIVMWQFEQLQDSTTRVFGVFNHVFWAFPLSIEWFKYC